MSEHQSYDQSRREAVGDADRLAALRETELLDSPTEEAFERLTELVTQILGVPVALVSLVDEERQFFKSARGLAEPWASRRETPLSHSFCKHLVESGEPLVVSDARDEAELRHNLAIPELGVVAYAGIPLTTPDGYVLGSLCAIDGQPVEWTEEQLAVLRELAEWTVREIEVRRAWKGVEAALDEARTARDEAEAASREKTAFLARMSHELRTPLNAIIGFSGLLQKKADLDDRSREWVDRVRENGRQLLHLVDDILDLSKIEAGRVDLVEEEVDLGELVDATLARMEATVPGGVDLETRVPEGIDPVMTDGQRLGQILTNLLSNAFKFTREGSVTVEIDAEGRAPRTLSVRDTGIGIREDRLEAIFQPFEQAETDTTRHFGGTGLGLPICHSLAEQMGYRLEVRSVPGEGSTFTLHLA